MVEAYVHSSSQAMYRIGVQGYLDETWSALFEGFVVENNANGVATLTGNVIDQAELCGILNALYDRGYILLSVMLISNKR